jgi:hypothetical protein
MHSIPFWANIQLKFFKSTINDEIWAKSVFKMLDNTYHRAIVTRSQETNQVSPITVLTLPEFPRDST